MSICEKCNAEIKDGSKFCPKCKDTDTEKLVPCKKCKKEVKLGIKICPYCGDKYPTATLKATIMTLGTILLIIWMLVSLLIKDTPNERKITKAEYGDKWAFTYEKAVLKCYKDGDIKSPIIELNGIPYGLTGFADNKYGQGDLNALNKYWLEDTSPYMKGTHISVGIFTDDALKLCD
jgi:RNA polymerase subunit RPABC4/transcription elongation factor Spt4